MNLNWSVRGGRGEVFPFVSRVQDVGALGGVHVPSAEWHLANQFNEYWVGSLPVYSGGYRAVL